MRRLKVNGSEVHARMGIDVKSLNKLKKCWDCEEKRIAQVLTKGKDMLQEFRRAVSIEITIVQGE